MGRLASRSEGRGRGRGQGTSYAQVESPISGPEGRGGGGQRTGYAQVHRVSSVRNRL